MIIMDDYILDDLKSYVADHLYKSGNKVVDDFIRNAQIDEIDSTLYNNINMLEFVPYDQFRDIESKGKFSKAYKEATWIDGNIQSWNKKEMNFKRSGPKQVVLKRLNNSESITYEELRKVQIN